MRNLVKIQIALMVLTSSVVLGLTTTGSAQAQNDIPAGCPGGPAGPKAPGDECPSTRSIQGDCPEGYIKLSVPLEGGNDCIQESGNSPNLEDNVIFRYLGPFIRFLSIGVGLVVALMIVIAGIQYITSAGNPQGIEAAKRRLTNAVIALLLYIFMAAILNFLVPGGFL